MANHVYIARVQSVIEPHRKEWWVWDKNNILKGEPGESRNKLLIRWTKKYGRPEEATRYPGIMRPSEAAMTVGQTRRLPPVR